MIERPVCAPTLFEDPAHAAISCDALLVQRIVQRRADLGRPVAIGLSGSQGSGKSTMAARLTQDLTRAGCPATVLSLDDFYLRRDERMDLAREIHPLLATRGVPGTHDVELASRLLGRLLVQRGDIPTTLPLFDKTRDERAPLRFWKHVSGPVDVVLVEGWCVGARAQPALDLVDAVNRLESQEDSEGRWRRYVNLKLEREYAHLFARLDLSIFLKAPSFDIVEQWRAEQEAGLTRPNEVSGPPMNPATLRRFVSHYERVTRWMLRDEPADLVVDLDAQRIPLACRAGSADAGAAT